LLPEYHPSRSLPFSLEVYPLYAAVMRGVERLHEPGASVPNLGGQLLWGEELDATGRALAVAASVGGAATLVAAADPAQQKQAIRDGVVNFLVTSLDEALRILKNEIRKRQPVAVCVGTAVEAVEREMAERGVRPDLMREGVVAAATRGQCRGPIADRERDPMAMEALVIWKVDTAPAVGLAKLDEIALECLDPEDHVARRWIRLAGRTMGRLGHDGHALLGTREFGARLAERVRELTERGEIEMCGEIEIAFLGGPDLIRFGPSDRDQAG